MPARSPHAWRRRPAGAGPRHAGQRQAHLHAAHHWSSFAHRVQERAPSGRVAVPPPPAPGRSVPPDAV